MCGIAGKIDFEGPVDFGLLERMCRALEHRGPDYRGIHIEDGVGLGSQRLAIIDVAGGHQPVFNEDRSVAVVMNGEIYNFLELREGLQRRGHRFRSRVDTEVLVHLYEDLGTRMVNELRGMFAFAIWDRPRQQLFCARDRLGKKPLFWSRQGSRIWFASELVALLEDPEVDRAVDPDAIEAYLALQYVPHPLCGFRHVQKLPPASTITITRAGERIEEYWSLNYRAKLPGISWEEAEGRLRDELREATRIRLLSEVPLGAFLSGGVDSASVVATMADVAPGPVKTFSIGFPDEAFDEVAYARLVAQHFATDHHEFIVEPEALSVMPKLARHYGEPYADPSAIPSFYLAELTAPHVTVTLNGDGGDENFAGYARYRANHMLRHVRWSNAAVHMVGDGFARLVGTGATDNSTRSRINRIVSTIGLGPAERYANWMSPFPPDQRARLFTPEFAATLTASPGSDSVVSRWHESTAPSDIDRMLDVDVHTYLPGDLLVKMDIATMAHSVETRSPFLDHKLMEFVASLPSEFKLSGKESKRLLKSAMRGIVPDEILRRPKMGFGVPLVRWFRKELRHLPEEILLDPIALGRGYFDSAQVERLIREHHQESADHSLRLWALLQLEMWHREVVAAAATPAPATSGT